MREFFGDFVIYRNLVPADRRLAAGNELSLELGLTGGPPPRKAENEYGLIVAEMLRQARKLDFPKTMVKRLVYIGDTHMNDGTAFRNICLAGSWPGWAFIGQEDMSMPRHVVCDEPFVLANRWSALSEFLSFLDEKGFVRDEETVVVIDVDKTAIGAKGRNDGVIDDVRVESAKRTVADVLGTGFNEEIFRAAYSELKQAPYHLFTADNQDYLAYICLILGAGIFTLDQLIREIRSNRITGFVPFITLVQNRREELGASGLTTVHDDVWSRVQRGDPTPFKLFRYIEYQATISRFGDMPGETVEEILRQRIVITQEVRDIAMEMRRRGALIFGVSDKPDEAAFPLDANTGLKPLHRAESLAVGEFCGNMS